MNKVIGIVGSRRRNMPRDRKALEEALDKVFEEGDVLVSGGCPLGADAFAELIARERGLSILIHHADWRRLGRYEAGFARNTKIAESCDILLAVVARDRKGGTEDTVKKALDLGKEVVLIPPVEGEEVGDTYAESR